MNGPLDALAELVVTLNVAYEDEVLALKKTGEIEAAGSIVARCYVNSTSTIDLAEIIAEQYKLAATPSRHVCVTRLAIVESRNEKAVDVAFRCTRPAMLPHHCHIAKCQNSARNEPPCLLVRVLIRTLFTVHPNTSSARNKTIPPSMRSIQRP